MVFENFMGPYAEFKREHRIQMCMENKEKKRSDCDKG